MYIKLKSGKVIQTSRMIVPTIIPPKTIQYEDDKGGSGEVLFTDIEKITEDRPELISWEEAQRLMYKYLAWSRMADSDDEQYVDMIKNTAHDIMDYLCHTQQYLTPTGFYPLIDKVPNHLKVKVVKVEDYKSGTIEYRDIYNRPYFTHPKHKGIIYGHISEARFVAILRNVELEIVPSLTSAEVEGEPSLYVDKNHPDYKGDLGKSDPPGQLFRRNDGPNNSYVEG